MRQTSFDLFRNYKKTFGGSELVGRRKTARPLSTKSPIHLILKSESQRCFHPGNQSLRNLILKTAHKFNIQIREYAINWFHIHFIIQIHDRADYVRFIRALTSKLAMAFLKSKSINRPKQTESAQFQTEKLFTLRPFTRILNWGRDYKNVVHYIFVNFTESVGIKRRKSTSCKKPKIRPGRIGPFGKQKSKYR